jgi:hypothetical protein
MQILGPKNTKRSEAQYLPEEAGISKPDDLLGERELYATGIWGDVECVILGEI